ncbi:hypothetical protein AS12_gp48 [Acinetobacter phage vB_AbaP_AS12]|uniref:Uncharacterized protein n=1 Tax=Acinetobacter phage vB_AbaP_AS12 TaxID=1932885 RepID=A0A218KRG7_9CAUD|nr:hypothetical protein FDH31_gp48 [Acinetobacter phage vB_AbaP_AS12]APW79836.1 hypothetical protein AS12_gp48 [Acinetobacter phage vB_AbaP_AS12]
MKVNLSALKKIKHSDAVNVVSTLGTVVESAKAVNSVQEYKGKDKVNKGLSGASKALEIASVVLSILK